MNCCILLIQKLKTNSDLERAYSHMSDLKKIRKTDKPFETTDSSFIMPEHNDIIRAWQVHLASLQFYHSHKFRSNGVMAYDIYLGYSKEASSYLDADLWKEKNKEWLDEIFGEGHTLALFFHKYDWHGNPYLHGHAIVVPVDEKEQINAYKYTGKKHNLIFLQDSYAEKMKPLGLKRGVKYNTGNQNPPRDYYTKLTNAIYGVELSEKEINETDAEYCEKIKFWWRTERAAHEREKDLRIQEEIAERAKSLDMRTIKIRTNRAGRTISKISEERTKTKELFGSEAAALGFARAEDLLEYALENYPDRFYAEKAKEDIEALLREEQYGIRGNAD